VLQDSYKHRKNPLILWSRDSTKEGFKDKYQVLILRCTLGAVSLGYKRKRPLLFAMGVTPEGKKEVIDFALTDKRKQHKLGEISL